MQFGEQRVTGSRRLMVETAEQMCAPLSEIRYPWRQAARPLSRKLRCRCEI